MLKENYSPLYFLVALGAGGLAVSFFMYLTFLVPHKSAPMATFDFIYPVLLEATWLSWVSAIALIFIIIFASLHFKLLYWNIKQYLMYKKTDAYDKLVNSNAEVTLMAIPLTLGMSINIMFVLGAVFIPSLWDVIEYLFPIALLAFSTVGYFAIKIFMTYYTRLITTGDFDSSKNNNLSQMISIFAFSMLAVGFAAPGAMSHYIQINAIGIFGAIFFSAIAILLLLLKFILGFKDMFKHAIGDEASPSLWIIIPILTLLGITLIRIDFGLDHHFDKHLEHASLFTLTSLIVSLQIIFGFFGLSIMKKINYFDDYVHGDKESPVSFALICPGVAFMIFGMFFINIGLVFNGVIDKYSLSYFLFMLPFMFIQFRTIAYFFKLKKKFSL